MAGDSLGDKMIGIRAERPEDIGEIRKVIEEAFTQAFGQAAETDLVDRLRENCPGLLSLVAANGDIVVGHILFSPVKIEGNKIVEGMGLAPMAVLPKLKRQGIGARMVQAGIEMLKSNGCPFVIVLPFQSPYIFDTQRVIGKSLRRLQLLPSRLKRRSLSSPIFSQKSGKIVAHLIVCRHLLQSAAIE